MIPSTSSPSSSDRPSYLVRCSYPDDNIRIHCLLAYPLFFLPSLFHSRQGFGKYNDYRLSSL